MAKTGKSVKVFNLEERKNSLGAITEVDVFQWRNTILDNISRNADYTEHCKESSTWGTDKIKDRGFEDDIEGDGTGKKKADQVNSMLTYIAAYAPKAVVREITRRSTRLSDIWNVVREWGGIYTTGSKYLEYYRTRMSYSKDGKDESPQEFFYRLRDSMEDSLIMAKDHITDDGKLITTDEDMTPALRSMIVLDWLDAVGGPPLVQHVHRVFAKDLESATLASIQTRIWKNIEALLKESQEEPEELIRQCDTKIETIARQVKSMNIRRGTGMRGKRSFQNGMNRDNSRSFRSFPEKQQDKFCKLCKASQSPNFRSHNISQCWLLTEKDRKDIAQATAKAQALFAIESDYSEEENLEEEDLLSEDQD